MTTENNKIKWRDRPENREKYLAGKKANYYTHLEKNRKDRLDYYHSNIEKNREKSKIRYQNNKEEYRINQRKNRAKAKATVFVHYGGICTCCEESNQVFLGIDHINNDGGKKRKVQRRDGNFYYWIIRNDFPDDLQLLCMNCNWGKYINNGVCPHKNGK